MRGSYLKNTNFENASIIGTEFDIFLGIKLMGCPDYYPLGWRCEDNYLVRDWVNFQLMSSKKLL